MTAAALGHHTEPSPKSSRTAALSRAEAFGRFEKKTRGSSKCPRVALVLKCFSFQIQDVILKIMLERETLKNPHQALMEMLNENNIFII